MRKSHVSILFFCPFTDGGWHRGLYSMIALIIHPIMHWDRPLAPMERSGQEDWTRKEAPATQTTAQVMMEWDGRVGGMQTKLWDFRMTCD